MTTAVPYYGCPSSPYPPNCGDGWEDVDANNPEAWNAVACASGMVGELPLYHYRDALLPTGLHRFFAYETPVGGAIGAVRYSGTITAAQPTPPKAPAPARRGTWVEVLPFEIRAYSLRRDANGHYVPVVADLNEQASRSPGWFVVVDTQGHSWALDARRGTLARRFYYLKPLPPTTSAPAATAPATMAQAGRSLLFPFFALGQPPEEEDDSADGSMGVEAISVISGGKDDTGDTYQPDPSTGEPIPQDSASCHWVPDASNSKAVALANSISFHNSPVPYTDQGVYNTTIDGTAWRFVMWSGDCRGDGGTYHCVSAFRCVPQGAGPTPPSGGGTSTASMVGGGLVLAALVVAGVVVAGFAGRSPVGARHVTEALLY